MSFVLCDDIVVKIHVVRLLNCKLNPHYFTVGMSSILLFHIFRIRVWCCEVRIYISILVQQPCVCRKLHSLEVSFNFAAYKMPNNKKIQKKILPSQPTLDKFYSSNGVTRREEPCYLEKYVDEKLASASGNSVPDVSQNISATRDNFTFCADRQKPYEGGNIADSGSIDDCQLLLPIATSSVIKNVPKQLPVRNFGF